MPKIQYITPEAREYGYKSVSLDIQESHAGCGESPIAVIQADGGDASVALDLKGTIKDVIDGNDWRGAGGLAMGLIDTIASAGATSVIVRTPKNVKLEADYPLYFAQNIDLLDGKDSTTTKTECRMCTTAVPTDTALYTKWTLTVAALSNTYQKGIGVVVQPKFGDMKFSSLGENRSGWRRRGIRPQLQAPATPTVTVATSVSTTTLSITAVTITPTYTGTGPFTAYVDLYVFRTKEAAMIGPLPNQMPDSENNQLISSSVTVATITTYGGEADQTLTAEAYYWIVAVVKDSPSWFAENRSLPSIPVRQQVKAVTP